MRKFLLLWVCLATSLAFSQLATVTGTITDSDGTAWANGSWIATLQPNPNASPNVLFQGSTNFTKQFQGSLDGTGSFSQSSVPRNDFIGPAGSTYTFTICPNASFGCTIITNISIAASSVSLSSTLSAGVKVPRMGSTNLTYGYSDTEVGGTPAAPNLPGGLYYNVSSGFLRLWSGSGFSNITGGGGGGTPGGANGSIQFNNSGAFGGTTGFSTNGTTTITGAANSILDLSAGASMRMPSFAGCTSNGLSSFCYDTTAKNTHIPANGADAINGAFASAPSNGDVVSATNNAGTVLLADSNVPSANLVTASSNFTLGNIPKAGGNNKTLTNGYGVQGSDTNLMTAGTVSGTGVTLCTDANGGATTSGCSSGSGTINSATQYSAAYYSAAGTANTISGLAAPTATNGVPQTLTSTPSGGVATAPTWSVAGVPTNAQVGTSYTIAATDRASYVTFNNAAAIAVTLPQAGTTGFASNFVTVLCDLGVGTATVTPTTSTISYSNGATYTSGATSMPLSTGQCAWIYSDNTNYFAIQRTSGGGGSGTVNSGTATHLAYYATSTNAVSDAGADLVFNGTHTYSAASTLVFDLSGATGQMKIPSNATAVASANAGFIFDTTKLAYHGFINGVDATFAAFTGTPTNGQCATYVTAGSTFTLGSSACGGISGSGTNGQGTFWTGGSSVGGSVNWTYSATSGHSVTQGANNADAFYMNRFTDTAPTGNFFHFQNNAKASDIYKLDVSGNTTQIGSGTFGTSGTSGSVALSGSSSGVVTIQPGAAAAGTYNFNLPTSAGTSKQILISGGGGSTAQSYVDFPDVKVIPAANCNNATAGAGWSIPAANAPTVACRAGTNNLGGVLQWANNNATTNAQFTFELPADWDTATQPYWNIIYGSGANTSGTVKWTISSACTKSDGSVSDDPAFVAETTSGGKTMAVANRMWAESAQFANLTSGNNCIAGSTVIVKITSGNGTATSTVNVEQMTITVPRLITVQAN